MKKMKIVDLSKLLSPYKGKWVAMNNSETKVIAAGKSVTAVVTLAHKRGEEVPVIMKSPKHSAVFTV